MSMNPDDPRVKKTRRQFREAFIQLILLKGYDDISIQDIATAAESARITFYRHYKDKEELLTDCLNTLYEELVTRTPKVSRAGLEAGISPVITLYEHMQDQEALYQVLFSSRGTPIVIDRMRHHLAMQAQQNIESFLQGRKPHAPIDIIAHHAASAQLGLAIWWLEHGKPYPMEYMAQISVWMTLGGVLRTIGFEPFPLAPPTVPNR